MHDTRLVLRLGIDIKPLISSGFFLSRNKSSADSFSKSEATPFHVLDWFQKCRNRTHARVRCIKHSKLELHVLDRPFCSLAIHRDGLFLLFYTILL
jgi:hypothetical protein